MNTLYDVAVQFIKDNSNLRYNRNTKNFHEFGVIIFESDIISSVIRMISASLNIDNFDSNKFIVYLQFKRNKTLILQIKNDHHVIIQHIKSLCFDKE